MSDCYGFLIKEITGGQYGIIYNRHITVNGLIQSVYFPLKKTGRSVSWNVVIKTGVICLGFQKYQLNQRITSKNQNQRNAN